MVILYLFASFVGAAATIAALGPTGWLLALLCAPLGASALTLALGVALALMRTGKEADGPNGRVSLQA